VGSVAIGTVVATAYGLVRLPWTALTAVLGFIVMMGILVGCRLLFRIRPVAAHAAGDRWPVMAALAGAIVLTASRLGAYIGDPSNISQSNDAPFHLGAVRAIIEHAQASSLGLGGIVDPEVPGAFYPGAWHGTTALIAALTGTGIAEATNVMTLVVGAIVWPLGVAWLTQTATERPLAAAAAVALSPALLAFPLLMIQYGILYSYLLAVALLPASIAVVVELGRRRTAVRTPLARVASLTLAGVMVIAAVGASQPSALLAWGLAAALYCVGGAVLIRRDPNAARRERITAAVGAAALVAVLCGAWWAAGRSVTADYWGPVRSLPHAALDIASSGYAGTQAAWWLSLLGLVGLGVLLLRSGTRWLALTWLALAGLYGVAAAIHSPWLRLSLVGPWYSDTYRLAALLPLVALPIAGAGVAVLVDRIIALWRRSRADAGRGSAEPPIAAWATVAAILLVNAIIFALQPVVQRYHVANGVTESRSAFTIAEDTWLTLDERALIERLSETIEPGARVLGNPGTGAAFGYALSGADVYPAKWQLPRGSAFLLLGERLAHLATDPEVCAAVDALDADYVLDFGSGDAGTGRVEMPGFTGFEGLAGFELADREGLASLWRITGCE
ncbi:MAG: hypothetical protein M3Y31_09165, partial [Gemmatimonadota bacterium]|nr:hypothetical protein [Gemmatimonadota bacterium]